MHLPLTISHFLVGYFLFPMMISSMRGCNHILGLLKQTITNLVALNNRLYSVTALEPEVGSQGLGAAAFPLQAPGGNLASSSLWWLLAVCGIAGLPGSSLQFLPLSSCSLLPCVFLSVCVSISLFSSKHILGFSVHPNADDLILRSDPSLDYLCKDPFPKQVEFICYRYTFGGPLFHPLQRVDYVN